jgi:hypothetical protein
MASPTPSATAAERQIDPPDQPVDQRIGGGEQCVDGGKRDGVDELLQRVSRTGRELRQALTGERLAALALGLRQEALEIKEPRLASQALSGFDRHQIEPVSLERGATEAADNEMRPAGRALLARRVIDAHARAPERGRRHTKLADGGAVGVQHRGHLPAEPELLVIGRPAASGDAERQQQDDEAEPAHGGNDTRSRTRQPPPCAPLLVAAFSRQAARS